MRTKQKAEMPKLKAQEYDDSEEDYDDSDSDSESESEDGAPGATPAAPAAVAAAAAAAEDGSDDEADDDDAVEAAPAAAPATAKKPRQRKAAAAANGNGTGAAVVTLVQGVLSQVLNAEMVQGSVQQSLQRPEVAAALQYLNSLAGSSSNGNGVSAVRKPKKPRGPSDYNVLLSVATVQAKAADSQQPMPVLARAWSMLDEGLQQQLMAAIKAVR